MKKEMESEEIGLVSYAVVGEEPDPEGWVLSTGTTLHVCNSRAKFHDYRPVSRKQHVSLVIGGGKVDVAGIGSVTLTLTSGKKVTLTDVAHIPTLVTNIVSLGTFSEQGFEVTLTFGAGKKAMIYKDDKFVGNGCIRGGLFHLNVDNDNPEASST